MYRYTHTYACNIIGVSLELSAKCCRPIRTPNLPTIIVDFRGFDSSTILISRGGIPRPEGIS